MLIRIPSRIAWYCAVAFILLPNLAQAQNDVEPRTRIGLIGGAGGGGPLGVLMAGLNSHIPVSSHVGVGIEASTWDHGNGVCTALGPNRCDGGGSAALVGIVVAPWGPSRLQANVGLQGGIFDAEPFRGSDTQPAGGGVKPAAGLTAGVEGRIGPHVGLHLEVRAMRVFRDSEFRATFDRSLRYTMMVLGLSYYVGS